MCLNKCYSFYTVLFDPVHVPKYCASPLLHALRSPSSSQILLVHLHLVPRSRMFRAVPPLLQYAFMAWRLVKKSTDTPLLLAFCSSSNWVGRTCRTYGETRNAHKTLEGGSENKRSTSDT